MPALFRQRAFGPSHVRRHEGWWPATHIFVKLNAAPNEAFEETARRAVKVLNRQRSLLVPHEVVRVVGQSAPHAETPDGVKVAAVAIHEGLVGLGFIRSGNLMESCFGLVHDHAHPKSGMDEASILLRGGVTTIVIPPEELDSLSRLGYIQVSLCTCHGWPDARVRQIIGMH